MLGDWEFVLILCIALLLLGAKQFSPSEGAPGWRTPKQSDLIVWIAQGFGIGKIPFGPGTFGSVLGLLWFALLLMTQSTWAMLACAAAGVGVSVWLCGV